jgi:hypothetical protein
VSTHGSPVPPSSGTGNDGEANVRKQYPGTVGPFAGAIPDLHHDHGRGGRAHPAYTERFQDGLARPGLRIPLTAEAALFGETVSAGRRVIWLHTYGEAARRRHVGEGCIDNVPPERWPSILRTQLAQSMPGTR